MFRGARAAFVSAALFSLPLRRLSCLSYRQHFRCLRQLIVELTVSNRGYQGVDCRRQLVDGRYGDRCFALVELDRLPADADEEGNRAIRMHAPPRQDPLRFLDLRSLTVLLHPCANGAREGRISEQCLCAARQSS